MTRLAEDLTQAAGEYLKLGLAIIALTGKTPNVSVHKRGLHQPLAGAPESDADWDLIAGALHHPDTTGVGIVIPYPYVVVDIDGEEGAKQWKAMLDDEQAFYYDRTWTAQTGRGLHLWYSSFVATGSIKLGEKLDLKGQASYVAAPPSQHPDGRVYEWLRVPSVEFPPIEVPEPLAARIRSHTFNLERRLKGKEARKTARKPRYVEGDTKFYAQLGYEALFEGMATAQEGNRNAYLHWAAATLAEEGGIDEDFNMLAEAALAVGLEPEEVRRTVRSARRLNG